MSGALAARQWRRVAPLALTLALGVQARGSPAAEPDPPPWRVLILYGTPFDVPATAAVAEALRSALSAGAAPRLVNYHTEVFDVLTDVDHEAELLALLAKKHYAGRLDLVTALGGESLRFVTSHRERLWPGVPIVSVGTSQETLAEGRAAGNATGVTLGFDEEGTLRLARRLQPHAERLVLVAGASEYDRGWWPRLEAAAGRGGNGLEVEKLFGQSLGTVLDRVSNLPRRSIVLYTSISRDADGQVFVPALVAEMISEAAVAPVYTVLESQVGTGVIGGSMESFAAQGRRGAAVALRVLGGARPEDVAVPPPATPVPIVDWRQLQRFRLSASVLPPESEIRFRQPSILEEYKGYVVAAGLALAVQSGLIAALLVQGRRRRRAEVEAARQRAELAHASRLSAVGELTASIAHEVNQPLGAILSNAEAAELFLDADPPNLDRVRRILRDIREEDLRASEVIREVRALARKEPPRTVPLSVNDVVVDVLPLVAADARRRDVEVATDLGAALPVVSGDRTQLRQVVLNLALNALEALGLPGPGDRRVRIRTRAADSHVALSVSDTGPGLAEEDIRRLFESFFTTKAQGLGLGLSIVRSIVEAHGGRVAGRNNEGPGATFTVELPALRAATPPRRPETG